MLSVQLARVGTGGVPLLLAWMLCKGYLILDAKQTSDLPCGLMVDTDVEQTVVQTVHEQSKSTDVSRLLKLVK